MCNQRFMTRGDVLIDWLKDGVVRKNVVAIGILEFHADVFPYFYRDSTLFEILIYLLNRRLSEAPLVELIRVKGGAYGDATITSVNDFPGLLMLPGDTVPRFVRVIDNENIQEVQVEPVEHGIKCRIAYKNVRVRVNGIECGELL